MHPRPRHHRPNRVVVHRPYISSHPAAAPTYPQPSAASHSPSQTANPTTQFGHPPFPAVTASPAAAARISSYPLSNATPYRPPQTATPTTQSYPPPSPIVSAAGSSNYSPSTPVLYRRPQNVIPTTQFHPTTYRTVSATRASNFPLPAAVNSATPYRPPQTNIPTTRFRPIPPHSAAVNHPQSNFTNRPISRPDLVAVPISGEDYQRRQMNEAISDIPWSVSPASNIQPESDWTENPALSIGDVTKEDESRLWAYRVQKKALNSMQDYFVQKYGFESVNDEDIDEEDRLDDHDYLMRIFDKGDGELKSYYENNWRKGEFLCLVCGSGEKKFKDCVALVQHTKNIRRKKVFAHNSYGQAICTLLGWDIHNLPSVADNPTARYDAGGRRSQIGFSGSTRRF